MPTQVSVFKTLTDTKTQDVLTLKEVLGMIKGGLVQETVDKIKFDGNKELKLTLPCICFSGEFSERNKNKIITPSGLICLDFDNYENTAQAIGAKNEINKSEYVHASFLSPSGKGFKALIKINGTTNPETHARIYQSIFEHFNDPHLDGSGKDLARVCFMSHDINLYYNANSSVWTNIKNDTVSHEIKPSVVLPLSEQETVENLLQWWKKDHSATEGSRNNNIFVLASSFCRAGIDKNLATQVCLSESNGLSLKEVTTCVKSAYRANQFGSQPLENKEKLKEIYNQIITKKDLIEVVKKNNITLEQAEKIVESSNIVDYQFWTLKPKGGYKINTDLLLDFCHFILGLSVLENGDLIIIKENKAKLVDIHEIIRTIRNHFDKQNVHDKSEILDTLYRIKGLAGILKSTPYIAKVDNTKDDRDTTRIPFKNGILTISAKTGMKLIDYKDINAPVWESSIIDRDFKMDVDFSKSDIVTFFENLTRYKDDNGNYQDIHYDNLLSLQTTIGYLIHRDKGAMENKIVVLNDFNTSEEVGRNGGIGKGAFCDLVSAIRKNTLMFGPSTDYKDKFWKQDITIETDFVRIDETNRKFDIGDFFSLATDTVSIERKNRNRLIIPFEDVPRFVIATNYSVPDSDASTARRLHQVQFSDYGREVCPINEIGIRNGKTTEKRRLVSRDWNDDEWSMFYSFVAFCVMTYLENGLLPFENQGLDLKHARTAGVSEELMLYLDDKVERDNEHDIIYLYNEYIDLYNVDLKYFPRKKFGYLIRAWAKARKIKYETKKVRRPKLGTHDKREIFSRLYIFDKPS